MSDGREAHEIGTFVTDADLVIRGWNAALSELTGIAGDDACGRPLRDIAPDLEARGLLEVCEGVLGSGAVEVLAPAVHEGLIPCPPRVASPAFTRMQQRVTIGPLRDGDAIAGLIFTVEDVTGRRERERELAAALRSGDAAVRLRAARQVGDSIDVPSSDLVSGCVADEDWRVRHAAVQSLARRRRDALLASVLTALKDHHGNVNVVSSALHALALDGLDVLDPLLEFLAAPDADLRMQAALVLGLRRDARATGALVRALDDPDVNVRFHAIEALGRLGVPDAAERLAGVARTGDFFLAFAALEALGRLGDVRVTPVLLPLLDDAALGQAAADALGRLGDQEAAQALIDRLDHPVPGLLAVVQAVATVHDRYESAGADGRAPIRALLRRSSSTPRLRRLLDAVGSAGDAAPALALVLGATEDQAAVPGLVELLGVPAARHVALEELVRLGGAAVGALVRAIESPDVEVRRAAVTGLGRIGGAEAKAALLALVACECELLDDVAAALAALGDADAVDALVRLLGHEDPAARRAAIGALDTIADVALGRRLADLLGDPDPRLRIAALRLAARVGGDDIVGAVLARRRDADEEVRRAAVDAVADVHPAGAAHVLVEAIGGDTPRVRAAAARGLARVDGDDVLDALIAGLGDADPWVRYYSARAIGQRGGADATEMLTRLAEADPAVQVRIAAIDALGQPGRLEAVAPLGRLAASGERDLITPAVRALAAIGGTASRSVLLALRRAGDPERRLPVLEAMAEAGLAGAADELVAAAVGDPDMRVAEGALHALARLAASEQPECGPALAALMQLSTQATPRADVAVRDLAACELARLRRTRERPC